MSELAESHMNEFSKLMSLDEANESYEPKLQIPMRQVDESASHGDLEREATNPIFTQISRNNFLAEGVVLNMPIQIEEEVLDLENSIYRSVVPRVLECKVVEDPGPRIILPVDFYSSTEGSFPASPELPLSKSNSLGPIQPLPQSGEKATIPQFNSLPGEEKRVVRIRVAPDDQRKKGDEIKRPDGLCGYKEIDDEELEDWGKIGISLAQSQSQSNDLLQSPSGFEQFFENIVTQTNPDTFFKTLNEYVSSIKNGIKEIFPSPAPASPRAEPNNGNGKGKQ